MRVWDEPIRRDGRGRIDDWRAAIATGLLIGGLLVGMQACGSDDAVEEGPVEKANEDGVVYDVAKWTTERDPLTGMEFRCLTAWGKSYNAGGLSMWCYPMEDE